MPQNNNAGISPALVESIAGLSAGTISTLVVHPLDIVKTRMQRPYPLIYPIVNLPNQADNYYSPKEFNCNRHMGPYSFNDQ